QGRVQGGRRRRRPWWPRRHGRHVLSLSHPNKLNPKGRSLTRPPFSFSIVGAQHRCAPSRQGLLIQSWRPVPTPISCGKHALALTKVVLAHPTCKTPCTLLPGDLCLVTPFLASFRPLE